MTDTHIKINNVTPRVQYTGNGSTTSFPYSFAIFDESDMVVYVGDEVIESGYTVTGAGQTEGGNVVFDTAPEDGAIITLLRNVPIERVTDFQEGGTFRPKNINDELDRLTAFTQQVQEGLDRAVKVDPTSSTNPEDVIPKVEALYDDIANLDAVADDLTNIDTVASNISDVGTCATNMEDIQAAPGAATTASNAAIAAAASASSAAISAAGTHFKLFHHDWFDYELDDMAWLRADTFSWQDGTVYTEAYNHLVDDVTNGTSQTETISGHTITYTLADDGHKIVSDANASEVEGLYNDAGVAWYYILDLVNHKFKLPRTKYGFTGLRDYVGKYVPESLPNIKGSINPWMYTGTADRPTGAFYEEASNVETYNAGAQSNGMKVGFSANLSSSVYQDNAPVQQRATQMYLYFYVGQFTQSATEQTAGLNSELFNGKVDLNAANLSTEGKSLISGLGMPSTRYEDLTLGASGSTYTATANGWAYLAMGGGTNPSAEISSDTIATRYLSASSDTRTFHIYLPIAKGQTFKISYSNVGNLSAFRFIYAQGEPNV